MGLLHGLLAEARASTLDLPARMAAVELADCEHWTHWCQFLRWLEDPRRADHGAAQVADEVLRTCAVCSELRLELIA
jgi:hypothetical protein